MRMVYTVRVWYIPYAYGIKYAYGIEHVLNNQTLRYVGKVNEQCQYVLLKSQVIIEAEDEC